MAGNYVITGDTSLGRCLVMIVGPVYKNAEEVLDRMLNNPTENDKRIMNGHTDFKIKFVEEKDCWWNYNCD